MFKSRFNDLGIKVVHKLNKMMISRSSANVKWIVITVVKITTARASSVEEETIGKRKSFNRSYLNNSRDIYIYLRPDVKIYQETKEHDRIENLAYGLFNDLKYCHC